MPLTHTKDIANDGRCAATYGSIETVLGRARECHEAWKRSMADFAIQIANLETVALSQRLFCEYVDTAAKVAEGFVKVGKYRLKIRPKILSEKEIAHLGIFSAFENVDDSHWTGLRFVESGDHEILQRFYEKFEKFHGIDSDAIRDRHTDTTPEGGTHPDDELIE